jgi:hypothetical protein
MISYDSSLEVACQNGLRLTLDFSRESWPYCRLWFQKLTVLSTMVSKVDRTVDSYVIATVATSRLSIFRGFCLIDFCGKVASKSPNSYKIASNLLKKNPSKSTVDYVADPRSCNSWLFSRESLSPYCRLWFQKLTMLLSTMVTKVDRTVDFKDFNRTNADDFSKKSPATVDLWPKVDCRLEGLIWYHIVPYHIIL